MKFVKKSVVALGVLSLVLSLNHVESFAKPFVKKASKKVEKTVTITSKKDLTKAFNKNLLKLKGRFSFKISTSVVKNRKALVKVLSTGVKKDAGATVVYKFTKNKKPSVKKTGKFLLVKFNMKYDKKRISKALALAYEKGFITTKVTRWNEGITKAEGIDLIIKALGEVSRVGIIKNGLEVVEKVTEETEENTYVTEDGKVMESQSSMGGYDTPVDPSEIDGIDWEALKKEEEKQAKYKEEQAKKKTEEEKKEKTEVKKENTSDKKVDSKKEEVKEERQTDKKKEQTGSKKAEIKKDSKSLEVKKDVPTVKKEGTTVKKTEQTGIKKEEIKKEKKVGEKKESDTSKDTNKPRKKLKYGEELDVDTAMEIFESNDPNIYDKYYSEEEQKKMLEEMDRLGF